MTAPLRVAVRQAARSGSPRGAGGCGWLREHASGLERSSANVLVAREIEVAGLGPVADQRAWRVLDLASQQRLKDTMHLTPKRLDHPGHCDHDQ